MSIKNCPLVVWKLYWVCRLLWVIVTRLLWFLPWKQPSRTYGSCPKVLLCSFTTTNMKSSLHKIDEKYFFLCWSKNGNIPIAYMTKWKKAACTKISNDYCLKTSFFITTNFITVNLICQVTCNASVPWSGAKTNRLSMVSHCKQGNANKTWG